MNLHHWRYTDWSPFQPKHLVYKGGPERPKPESEKPKRDPMAELRALRAKMQGGREDLHRELRKEDQWKKRPNVDLEKWRRPRNAAAEKAMEDFLKWETPPEEVNRMQRAHELIYSHYVNPAFSLYINLHKKGEDKESFYSKVFDAMKEVVKKPDDFHYAEVGGSRDILEITSKKDPTGFLIRIEGGNIRRIKWNGLDKTFRVGKGETPWMENEEYRQKINDYTSTLGYEFGHHHSWQELYRKFYAEDWSDAKWMEEANLNMKKVIGELRPDYLEIYGENNWQYIRNLKKLIDARNFGFEKDHPAYAEIERMATDKGYAYELVTNPRVKGSYFIRPLNNLDNLIGVSKEGYLMVKDTEGNWQNDPRYNERVRKDYYKRLKQLEKDEQKAIKKEAEAPRKEETVNADASLMQARERILAADLPTLISIATILNPDTDPTTLEGYTEENKGALAEAIVNYLPNLTDDAVISQVLKALGMEAVYDIEAPPAAAKGPENVEDVLGMVDAMGEGDWDRLFGLAVTLAKLEKDDAKKQAILVPLKEIQDSGQKKVEAVREIIRTSLNEANFQAAKDFLVSRVKMKTSLE